MPGAERAVGAGTEAHAGGSRYRSYSQVEADFRLGSPPIRDGSTLSAYVRVIADGGDLRSAVPSQNAMLGVGLRWKPLRNQVIYLAAENQNGLDDLRRRDVLLRASASFLNGGRYGDDWHPSRSGWFSRNLYLDARSLSEDRATPPSPPTIARVITARCRAAGRWNRTSTCSSMAAEASRFERDLRTGVGVRWNLWYGANRYDAAPHKVSVGLEFQQALDTYLSDRNGLFLSVGTRW